MRILSWLVRAIIFFTLFAFALNNQHKATVHWFFGFEWTAPLVFVVLAAFAAGCVIGVLAMVPGRWRRHAPPRPTAEPVARAPRAAGAAAVAASDFGPDHPPREGL